MEPDQYTGLADVGSISADQWRLALDSTQPHILYAGAATGGVYKSSDGGGSWFSSGLEAVGIRDLVIDPTSTQTLYAATQSGVYKTTNGGGNWVLDNDGMGAIQINALAKHPTNPLLIYAATDGNNGGGVFWSQTGGDTWEPRRTGLLNGLSVSTIALALSNLQVLYASSGGALYKTTNSGATWTQVNLGNGFNLISAILVDPSNAQTVYVAAHGLFRNTTGGSGPWTSLNNGLPSGQVYAIVRDPSTPQTFYVAMDGRFTNQGGIYKSTTGGQKAENWHPMDTGLANFKRADFTALAINPTG